MGGFLELWDSGVVHNLAQALIFLTGYIGNYGISIILFTIAVKLIMAPLTIKQIKSSKAMMELQPKLKELQKKYGKDREKMMQEQMRLYKEHGVNPAAGCVPLLIQMPVWFGLYQAMIFLSGPGGPEFAKTGFLWIPSLAQPEGVPYVFALLTGATQWVIQRMMAPKTDDPQQKMMNQMTQFMPLMFLVFAFQVPAGLVLYWVTSNVFTFAQQYLTTGWGSLKPETGWSAYGNTISRLLGSKDSNGRQAKSARGKGSALTPASNGSRRVEQKDTVRLEDTAQLVNAEEESIAEARSATAPSGARKKKKARRR